MSEQEYHDLRRQEKESQKKFQRNLFLILLPFLISGLVVLITMKVEMGHKADKIELEKKADKISSGSHMELMRLVESKHAIWEAYVLGNDKYKEENRRRLENVEREIIEIYKQMGEEPTRGFSEEQVYINPFESPDEKLQ